jgi:hypothetical protein
VVHGVENQAGLHRAAGAEFHQRGRPQLVHQRRHLGLEYRPLGARQVILGQFCDVFEQLRAAMVVEVLGRQLLLRLGESAGDVAQHGRAGGAGKNERISHCARTGSR